MTAAPKITVKQSASYELRKLIYDTLSQSETLTTREYLDPQSNVICAKVYDTVPKGAKPPYVTIGKAAIKIDRAAQTKDVFVDLYMLEIDFFTHYGGKADVSQLMNDAMAALSYAWAIGELQFTEDSAFLVGLFEIDVRGEDVSVWGPKDREHNIMTCNIQVIQTGNVCV